jgi:hypothetical protein
MAGPSVIVWHTWRIPSARIAGPAVGFA